jgi:hypothetical protein
MNRYLFLHRVKGPVMILVFGLTALLDQWHILSYGESWPLYLIVFGALQLAERAAWTQAQYPEQYPGAGPGPGPGPNPGQDPYAGRRGNWGSNVPPPPSSTALTITPPDLPRDITRGEGNR